MGLNFDREGNSTSSGRIYKPSQMESRCGAFETPCGQHFAWAEEAFQRRRKNDLPTNEGG